MVLETGKSNILTQLFKSWEGIMPLSIQKLPVSGSGREYYRLESTNKSAIGVYNENKKENEAFIAFTMHFLKHKLNVPQVYATDLNQHIYLLSDLGDNQLLQWLNLKNKFDDEALKMYKKVIQQLILFQVKAGSDFDFTNCYPYSDFNKESILFDLNYFKTSFVDALNLKYKNERLEKDFNVFADYLLSTSTNYFVYRDFQSRNILLKNNEPWFIDYQGGRRGALQYDLVSLLFQAKAQIPEKEKVILLNYYMEALKEYIYVNKDEFTAYYYAYALVRVLQTFGAYGFRGIVEGKKHFIESIPLAVNNLIYLKDKVEILKQIPELNSLISTIIQTKINVQ